MVVSPSVAQPASPFPYPQLAALYGLYFAFLGAFIPYWGLYLQDLGYRHAQIGQLMAIVMGAKIVAPNLFAWWAQRSGRQMGLIRLASALASAVFAGVLWADGYFAMAAVLAGFSLFWHAILPQIEVLTLDYLGPTAAHRYGRIRLWGSIGFIGAVVGLGPLLGHFGVALLVPLLLALLLALVITTWTLPAPPPHPHAQGGTDVWSVLRQPATMALLGSCLLMQASHGPYYSFFSIFLEERGYPRGQVGLFWALGVMAEIGVFLVIHRHLPHNRAEGLLLWSMLLTAGRWLLIAVFVDWVWVLLLAQLLHAASYGLFHAAAIHLLQQAFAGPNRGAGQALYAGLSFGLGGALGSLCSGLLWERLGGQMTFALAGAVAAAAGWLVIRGYYRPTVASLSRRKS